MCAMCTQQEFWLFLNDYNDFWVQYCMNLVSNIQMKLQWESVGLYIENIYCTICQIVLTVPPEKVTKLMRQASSLQTSMPSINMLFSSIFDAWCLRNTHVFPWAVVQADNVCPNLILACPAQWAQWAVGLAYHLILLWYFPTPLTVQLPLMQ